MMSNTFQGLRTTVYMVPDLQKAKQWYADILGIDPYFDTDFYVGFNVGGYELGLHPQSEDTVFGTSVNTYWGVDDVAGTLTKMEAAGATIHEPANNVGGEIVLGSVKDPWGNIVGVIYNPEFKL